MILKPRIGIRPMGGHPLAKSLGCWLFNECPPVLGTVNDLSGNGNTGTLVGHTHSVPGKFGSALDFDGTGDWVDIPAIDDNPQNFTLAAWVKHTAENADFDGIVDWTGDTKNDGGFIGRRTGENRFAMYVNDGSWQIAKSEQIDALLNTWYHVVGVADHGTVKIYVNGILAPTTDTYGTVSWNDGVNSGHIGSYAEGDEMIGQIDHVMIYNRALSAGEVMRLYNNSFCMFEVDL